MEAQEMGMMETRYMWRTTQEFTSLWDYVLNASTMSSLQGLLGIKTHILNSKKLNDFPDRWERQFRLDNPNMKNSELNAYGLMAYDTILVIARAIEKIARNSSLSFLTPSTPLAVVASTKIKVFQEGRKLLREIFLTNFAGLSGPVKFHDGEMHGCSYDIVNIVGKSYQMVGYWPYNSSVLFKTPSFDNKWLRSLIWPSGFSTVPRGWVLPTRLKIAVPTISSWDQFVNVSFNPDTNETTVNGLSIDVFHAIVRRLDYQLLYDFIPFPEHRNYSENSLYLYDELVRQVYHKKYDAVLGDITTQGAVTKLWSSRNHTRKQAYEEALSKGALKNGGVDAILDELPYVRAFLSGRCGYSMVGRTYHRGGFGFVSSLWIHTAEYFVANSIRKAKCL
ncbi:hypothetical protein SUGI_0576750 [Cryptomeria japonica]|nr:hypothetical protein SUGI_0576750 [Cryptomeria japonica]